MTGVVAPDAGIGEVPFPGVTLYLFSPIAACRTTFPILHDAVAHDNGSRRVGLKGMTEFRPNDLRFKQWKPLTDRELKSLVVEEMKEGGESWMNDIRTYIESAHIEDYNPIHE